MIFDAQILSHRSIGLHDIALSARHHAAHRRDQGAEDEPMARAVEAPESGAEPT